MSETNPFLISDYVSPELFCNRSGETKRIISAMDNGRNLTLLSIGRLRKTGLIKHVFNKLQERKNIRLLYIDIISQIIITFTNCIIQL